MRNDNFGSPKKSWDIRGYAMGFQEAWVKKGSTVLTFRNFFDTSGSL